MQPDVAEATDAWPATIAAAVLRRGSMVHVVSVVLTLAAPLGWAIAPRPSLLIIGGVIFVAGLVEFWLAARVALDADLFGAIASRANDVAGFDRAMRELGLMSTGKISRALPQRISAAFRLLKLQVAALGVQIAVLIAGTLGT